MKTVSDAQFSEALMLIQDFAAINIIAIYGGTKGHGFWLYPANPEAIRAWIFEGNLDLFCPRITNDGAKSGNPYFTMFDDAKVLHHQLATTKEG